MSSNSPTEKDILFRTEEFIKRCTIIQSKDKVLFAKDQTDYQIIVIKGPTNRFTVYLTKDAIEGERIFIRLSAIFNKLDKYITFKQRSRIIRLFASIVDASLLNLDWQWIHVAAYVEMQNVFNPSTITKSKLNNNKNGDRLTPLLLTIKFGKLDMVKAILSCKPDLTPVDIEGNLCLHLAALSPVQLLRLVIKECYQHHGLILFEKVNNLGLTPFHLSCYHEKISNVIEFLKVGLSICLLTLGKSEIVELVADKEKQVKDKTITSPSANLTNETRVVFTGEMLNSLDLGESKYGGSPLHWCKGRKLMSTLIDLGFDLNILNLINETPLFSMIRKQRLDCMLPLLNGGASVDIFGPEGQTPLHFAIEKGYREGFQALIVFDCDFNLPNKKGLSPRHYISQITTPAHLDMLYVLAKLGASRCPKKFTGCKDGCSHYGTYNGQPLTDWPEAFQNLGRINSWPKKADVKSNSNIKSTEEQKSSERSNSGKVNMLCIDGGGIKGLFGIQSLLEIQKLLDKPLIDYFEWIGATSTGAIIASSLVIGKSLKQLRADYFELKNEIFNVKRPHNTEALELVLKKYVGTDTKISSVTWKKLMITSILADRDPPRLHLFRSYKPIVDLNESLTPKEMDDINLWEAIRASSAAPVFFKPYGPFIDGGLLSNNPTLECLTEFFNYNCVDNSSKSEIDDHAESDERRSNQSEMLNLVLSIGNGKPRPTPVVNYDFGNMAFRRNPVGAYRSAIKYITLGELMVKMATHPDNHIVQRCRAWCKSLNIPYCRLNPPLKEKLKLDETRDEKIIDGMLQSKIYIYAIRDQILNLLSFIELNSS